MFNQLKKRQKDYMIFDSEIDKENAKFWCVFAGKTYDALQANVKQISKNDK